MNKKITITLIIIVLFIIGTLGISFLTNNVYNTDFKVLDDLSNLNNEKNSILENENNKFYNYEINNEKYIVFKIVKFTYNSSIDIKSVKLTNVNYSGEILNIELKVNVKEGKPDSLRDWPLQDKKYIIMKVKNNIEKLYVDGFEYNKI